MKIPVSQTNAFIREGHHKALRFGQAWVNRFAPLAKEDDVERDLIRKIFYEPNSLTALDLILTHFTDNEN
jgi:hypothetical protein